MIYEKYNGHCGYCGEAIKFRDMQIDHIIPKTNFTQHITREKQKIPPFLYHLTEKDVHHPDNLMPACRACNGAKSWYSLELFRWEIEQQLDRVNRYSNNYRLAKRYKLVQETPQKIVFYFETNPIFI